MTPAATTDPPKRSASTPLGSAVMGEGIADDERWPRNEGRMRNQWASPPPDPRRRILPPTGQSSSPF